MPEPVDEPKVWSTDEQIRGIRPPVDHLRMAAARERAQRSLFGSAAPARFGRYVLLGQSTDGGMGVIHAAYDPGLHRKVALKVLHPRCQVDERASERLIVEARALARLDHPNVVKVHDVITENHQVVIVMEWVDGVTLAGWEREQPRSWSDVVAVYAQAGQGLAAAHGVGVVHRDFKPANAIIGGDGRVRVLDFGLARSMEASPRPPTADTHVLTAPLVAPDAPSLTVTGDMVGTVAYAAPEQLAGTSATPASDQFSFAVSLHRALEGVAPYAGANAGELLDSIKAGRLSTAAEPRAIPKWLRAAVMRALSHDPAARFPSMPALLAELTRPRGWRRWRIPGLVGLCVAAVAFTLLRWPGPSDPLASCDGGRSEISAVWNGEMRGRVSAALHRTLATPDATDVRNRILRGLDDYRDRWIMLHRDACVAYRSGTQSAALLDQRMLCLSKRLGDLRAAVTVLARFDGASASKAVDVIARMPMLGDCADLESLRADVAPPDDPVQRARVAAVRSQLSQAMALDRAGQSTQALAAATATIAQAEQSGYPPIVAESALTQGRILLSRGDATAALAALVRARNLALEHRQFAIAVEAAARAIYLEGGESTDVRLLQRDADVFIPLGKALTGDHFAGPLLLNNLGTAYLAADNRAEATRCFTEAHAGLAGQRPELELTSIDANLGMMTPDADVREGLFHGVYERFRRELGESHIETLHVLDMYGRFVASPSRAFALASQACASFGKFYPDLIEPRVYCESYRAFLAGVLGDQAEERKIYDEIVSIVSHISAGSSLTGPAQKIVAMRAALAAGYSKLLGGEAAAALSEFYKITRLEKQKQWWLDALVAHAEVGLGLAAHALGREREAARHLTRSIEPYEHAIALNEALEYRQRLLLVRRAIAALRPPTGSLGAAGATRN